jgi:hypothetical protein
MVRKEVVCGGARCLHAAVLRTRRHKHRPNLAVQQPCRRPLPPALSEGCVPRPWPQGDTHAPHVPFTHSGPVWSQKERICPHMSPKRVGVPTMTASKFLSMPNDATGTSANWARAALAPVFSSTASDRVSGTWTHVPPFGVSASASVSVCVRAAAHLQQCHSAPFDLLGALGHRARQLVRMPVQAVKEHTHVHRRLDCRHRRRGHDRFNGCLTDLRSGWQRQRCNIRAFCKRHGGR